MNVICSLLYVHDKNMQSSSIHQLVLFLLSFTSITVPALDLTSVKAKLHQSVDLTCEHKCPGLLKWIMDKQPYDILAQCNQTSCSSKEGYKISHDQYKNGDLSLTIMEADYSKRTIYACECNAEDICHVRLCIEPVRSSVRLKPGEDLILDLPIPEPVEVIYNSSDSAGSHDEQLCTVVSRLQCKDEYTRRVSFHYPNLTLARVNVSDSGDYIVRDIKNDEVIRVYTVFVEAIPVLDPDTPIKKTSAVPTWVIVLMVVPMVLVGGAAVLMIKCLWRRNGVLQQREGGAFHLPTGALEMESLDKPLTKLI